MLRTACICASLLLSACATYPIQTASGRPEVTLNETVPQAKRSSIEAFSARGCSLVSEGPSLLTFQSQMSAGSGMAFLMAAGNANYTLPVWTIRLTFLQTGKQTKIFGHIQGSATSPFGQTKVIDTTTGRAGQELQETLESLKGRSR